MGRHHKRRGTIRDGLCECDGLGSPLNTARQYRNKAVATYQKGKAEYQSIKAGAANVPTWAWFAVGGMGLFMVTMGSKAGRSLVSAGASKIIKTVKQWDLWANKESLRKYTDNLRETLIGIGVEGPIKSYQGQRSPSLLDRVIKQFSVTSNPRYQPRDGNTFCNVFVQDVLYHLGVMIPTGNANSTADWFAGEAYGWKKVAPSDAQAAANKGQPAIGIVKESGHGHVVVVRPGTYSASKGPAIAQAGKSNFDDKQAVNGFGSDLMKQVSWYAHA